MKQKNTIYCLLLAALTLLAACKKDDTSTVYLYGDASIVTFTLGKLNQYTDYSKTSKTKFDGSPYTMHINQRTQDDGRRLIENLDSLPKYTDAAHVVCTVTSLNNGAIGIKNLKDDVFLAYRSTDSIDFTEPRVFRVVSSSLSGYTDYTVKLNVHKEIGDSIVWEKETEDNWNFLFNKSGLPTGYQYLGSSSYEEYALAGDGKLMSKAEGSTEWKRELADDDADLLVFPTADVSLVSYPMAMADSTDYVLLIGRDDNNSSVFRKIVDNTGKKAKGEWSYIDRSEESKALLPASKGMSLIRYDGINFAFSGEGMHIYESRDNGITWKESLRLEMPVWNPDGFSYDNIKQLTAKTFDDYIWLRVTYTDTAEVKVWRGRKNSLKWKKVKP